MQITKKNQNRFDIQSVADPKGIAGYHGKCANIIGWILCKIFHLTVRVTDGKNVYYLNRKSLANWLSRVHPGQPTDKTGDSRWVEKTIEQLVVQRGAPGDLAPEEPAKPTELGKTAASVAPRRLEINDKPAQDAHKLPEPPEPEMAPRAVPRRLEPLLEAPVDAPQVEAPQPPEPAPVPALTLSWEMQLPVDHPLTKQEYFIYPEERKRGVPQAQTREYIAYSSAVMAVMLHPLRIENWMPLAIETYVPVDQQAAVMRKAEERLALLEEQFQFTRRYQALGERVHLDSLTFQDLEAPWAESAIRVALLSNEELNALTMDQLKGLTPRQIEILIQRRADVTSKLPNTLGELWSLPAEKLNQLLPTFSIELPALFTEEQLQGLDFGLMSLEQRKYWFKAARKAKVQLLNKKQIEEITSWEKMSPKFLHWLSPAQLKQLELLKLKEPWRNQLFEESERDKYPAQALTVEQLYPIWELLTEKQLWLLSLEQIQSLDYTRPEVVGKLGQLFDVANADADIRYIASTRLKALNKEQLQLLFPKLSVQKLKELKPEQFKELDFTQFEDKHKPLFDLDRDHDAYARLWALEGEQLRILFPLLGMRQLGVLKVEQFKLLDFTKFKKEHCDALLGTQTSMDGDATKRLEALEGVQLNLLLPSIDPYPFYFLSKEKMALLDFMKISPKQLERLLRNVSMGAERSRVEALTDQQIRDGKPRNLFADWVQKHMKPNQKALLQ